MSMYAVQWYDSRTDSWLLCSTKGQLEIYHTVDRAQESFEKWIQSSKDNGCTDMYRVVSVVVNEE